MLCFNFNLSMSIKYLKIVKLMKVLLNIVNILTSYLDKNNNLFARA